jgi:predicted hydrocarbon binding protein
VPYIYSWGKFIGFRTGEQAVSMLGAGIGLAVARMFYPKIPGSRLFKEVFEKTWLYYKEAMPSVPKVEDKIKRFDFRSEEPAECSGFPVINKKVCFFQGGFMSGIAEALIGHSVNTDETSCIADGNQFCEFRAAIDSAFPVFLNVPSKEELTQLKRAITERMLAKRELIRKNLGDYTHIAPFQMIYIGMWLSSPGAHTMLYWVGKGSGSEMAKGTNSHDLKGRMEELKGVFEYLRIGLLEYDEGFRNFKVYESALSSGAEGIGKNICSYIAGMLAGFLEECTGKRYNVIETQCLASGADCCEFKVM